MSSIKEQLINMFSKVMAGTVSREEGTMLLNYLVKERQAETVRELVYLIETPPPGVFPKTILHTIALSRNRAFYNIMVAGLCSKHEDVSLLAAEELGKLKTAEAKNTLVEHLKSERYHVRKVSATALAQNYEDGPAMVEKELLSNPEPFFRTTYAQALARAGKRGIAALLNVMNTGSSAAGVASAEALTSVANELDEKDMQQVFYALMSAGDRKDSMLIIAILKLAGTLSSRVRGFEGYVRAFADHPADIVRDEAKAALRLIKET
ncbi:MAG: hypothetical protein HZB22_03830 [Deltaproteobacteria bacterium]|nr:hypothetical protein [Deltaproteobacteria bacterium]